MAPRLRLTFGYELRFSDDGSLLLCIGSRIAMFDPVKRERLWFGRQLRDPSHGSFSPDGSQVAIKNTSGRIVVLNARSGELLHDFKNQKEGEGCQLHFASNGDELIDGSWKGQVTVRDLTGSPRSREEFPSEMIERISHDKSRQIWLIGHSPRHNPQEPDPASRRRGYVRFRRWPFTPACDRVLHFPFYARGATLHPAGETFCFTEMALSPRIMIARAEDGSILAQSVPLGKAHPSELTWSPDGALIAAVQRGKFVFYRSSDLSIAVEVLATYPSSVAFSPGTQQVALGTWNESRLVPLGDVLKGSVKLK